MRAREYVPEESTMIFLALFCMTKKRVKYAEVKKTAKLMLVNQKR